MSRDILELPPPPADERLVCGPSASQFGDLRLPGGAGPHPVVVLVHGGYWRDRYSLEHLGHLAAALTAAGLATWSLEYRRLGQPGGGWPGTFLDVARGADALRELAAGRRLDPDRVIAMGHSAGGHLAVWLAARRRIPPGDPLAATDPLPLRGVVSLAGVADLRRGWELRLSDGVVEQLLGGTPEQVPQRYLAGSPFELLPLGLPQILIHGTEDDAVPFAISRRYLEAARAAGDPAELIPLPGAGHFEAIDPRSAAWPTVLDAARRLLAG